MILTLFDAVPNLYTSQYDSYPNLITFENIIMANLDYGVATVKNALWRYPSYCVPQNKPISATEFWLDRVQARPRFGLTEFYFDRVLARTSFSSTEFSSTEF